MAPAQRVIGSVLCFVAFAVATWAIGKELGQRRHRAASQVECLGAEDAGAHAVYLHGLDTFGPSWVELRNRRVLAELAAAHKLRIAMPRGPICGWGRCWPRQRPEDLETTKRYIERAAGACFAGVRSYGVIGFSNGGFAATELFENCELAELSWVISSGVGGSVDAPVPPGLQSCGRLHLLVGDRDRYRDSAQSLYRSLRDLGATVELIEFDGNHWLDFTALEQAVLQLREGQP